MPLSNLHIEKLVEKFNLSDYSLPVICKDNFLSNVKNLSEKHKLIHFCVINLQDSDDGNGTHWVCYFKCYSTIYYFDSFGVQPFQALVDWCNDKNYLLWYNTEKVQEDDWSCGYWCVKNILNIFKVIPFQNTAQS